MIFVAVGTTDFNALVEKMDNLSLELNEDVIIQIGGSKYIPQHCEYFRFVPSLASYYDSASLIISHGGLGIVTEVLELGKPLVAVEDPDQPDRHQREILDVWEKAGHLVWCRDMDKLPQAIEQAKTNLTRYQRPECTIDRIIADYLNTLK